MTTVKEYLYQIRHERREMEELKDRIEELHSSLLPAGIRYDKVAVQTSPTDAMSENIAIIADYEAQLAKTVAGLVVRSKAAQKWIARLEDSNERQVLMIYFLSFKQHTWEDVAAEMDYSVDSIYKIYRSGLEHLEAIWK